MNFKDALIIPDKHQQALVTSQPGRQTMKLGNMKPSAHMKGVFVDETSFVLQWHIIKLLLSKSLSGVLAYL